MSRDCQTKLALVAFTLFVLTSPAFGETQQHSKHIHSVALEGVTATASSEAAASAKERLHHSLYLPGSYEEAKASAETPPAAVTSKPAESQKPQPAQQEAAADADEVAPEELEADEPHWQMMELEGPQLQDMPCHHEHSHMPGFGLGDAFGTILSDVASEVFGVEHLITNQMQHMFQDLLSGPRLPQIMDVLDGIASPSTLPPSFLPPFVGGPQDAPVFGVVITAAAAPSDIEGPPLMYPTWEQQVIISSSSPTHLEQLADMFEQQLHTSSSMGRKLKSEHTAKVQAAQVAQVLLGAARKLRATGALPTTRK